MSMPSLGITLLWPDLRGLVALGDWSHEVRTWIGIGSGEGINFCFIPVTACEYGIKLDTF